MEETKSSSKNTGMAVVAYFLFFVPLLTEARKDPFVKFHVKQGLVLFIGYVIESVIMRMPVISFLSPLLSLVLLVLLIIGIMNAVNGQEKTLPIVGDFAKNFKF
jgi:uncharacterized membrane protein